MLRGEDVLTSRARAFGEPYMLTRRAALGFPLAILTPTQKAVALEYQGAHIVSATVRDGWRCWHIAPLSRDDRQS